MAPSIFQNGVAWPPRGWGCSLPPLPCFGICSAENVQRKEVKCCTPCIAGGASGVHRLPGRARDCWSSGLNAERRLWRRRGAALPARRRRARPRPNIFEGGQPPCGPLCLAPLPLSHGPSMGSHSCAHGRTAMPGVLPHPRQGPGQARGGAAGPLARRGASGKLLQLPPLISCTPPCLQPVWLAPCVLELVYSWP